MLIRVSKSLHIPGTAGANSPILRRRKQRLNIGQEPTSHNHRAEVVGFESNPVWESCAPARLGSAFADALLPPRGRSSKEGRPSWRHAGPQQGSHFPLFQPSRPTRSKLLCIPPGLLLQAIPSNAAKPNPGLEAGAARARGTGFHPPRDEHRERGRQYPSEIVGCNLWVCTMNL